MNLIPRAQWGHDLAFCKGMRVIDLRRKLNELTDDRIIAVDANLDLALMREDGATHEGTIDLGTEQTTWIDQPQPTPYDEEGGEG